MKLMFPENIFMALERVRLIDLSMGIENVFRDVDSVRYSPINLAKEGDILDNIGRQEAMDLLYSHIDVTSRGAWGRHRGMTWILPRNQLQFPSVEAGMGYRLGEIMCEEDL